MSRGYEPSRIGIHPVDLNQETIEMLKEVEWFIDEERLQHVYLGWKEEAENALWWISDEARDEVLALGDKHEGFPEILYGYSYGLSNFKFADHVTPEQLAKLEPEFATKLPNLIDKFGKRYSLRNNALFAVYPPGGFISWHNNANASAYNIIFTWSEKGEGFFRYYDWKTGKNITIYDRPGWQCKVGYFGPYGREREGLCYHTAYTECKRATFAFMITHDEMGMGIQDWIIEDISA